MIGELKGSFRLSQLSVEANVPSGARGVYLLSRGERSERNRLIVSFVGRSRDVRESLLSRLQGETQYLYFWYCTAESDNEAFEQECKDFHSYSSVKVLDCSHPKPPEGSSLNCPVCHVAH